MNSQGIHTIPTPSLALTRNSKYHNQLSFGLIIISNFWLNPEKGGCSLKNENMDNISFQLWGCWPLSLNIQHADLITSYNIAVKMQSKVVERRCD